MYDSLQNLLSRLHRANRRRNRKARPTLSFKTAGIDALEDRKLLAVAPVPSSFASARSAEAAYIRTVSFKAAAPTNLLVSVRNQGADLTWNAPRDTGGSSIREYVVQYRVANTFNWKTIRTGTTLTRATVSGLQNGTAYIFEVAAVNSTGTGGFARTATPVTPPGFATVAREPRGLSARSGNGETTLSWSAPSWDGGTPVTDYLVQYRQSGSSSWTTLRQAASNATTAKVIGLTNGVSHSFRVAAVNARGTGAFSSFVVATPASAPAAPMNLMAVSGNGTARLAWAAPSSNGGSAITGYEVFSSTDAGASWTVIFRTSPTSTQAGLVGLSNGTAYMFKVAAANRVGTGLFSNQVGPVTPAATVPAFPTNVATTIGDGAIGVRWAAPGDNGGSDVTGYMVQYSTDAGETWVPAGDSPLQGTNATVTGLANGTGYILRVAAINAVGRGTFSAATLPLAPATVPGQPSGIHGTAGNGSVLLNWSAPRIDGGNAVNDYAIQYSTNGGATGSLYPRTPSSATQATVNGLVNGIEYQFRLAAVNEVGVGAYSAPSAAVVPVAPVSRPGAPTALNARTGNGQVTLTWSEPTSNGNSVITAYEVSYSSDGRGTWSAPVVLPATARTTSIGDLVNGTNYQFRIVAVNAAGAGLSATVSATPTNPDALTTVQFTKVGTLPVTVQYSYTIRDANGKAQTRFLTVHIGSLDRSGAIRVPDFDRIEGTVRVSITVRNLPRGMTKTQSFTVAKKTNYSMRIAYQTNVSDPWMATSIQLK